MKQALQVRFLGMEPSAALEAAAREKAARLDRFSDEVIACRVTIDCEHKHQQQGRPFAVRIDLTLPGRELAVNRVQNEDAHVALRDAFDDMVRQLEDAVGRARDARQSAG